MAVERLAVCGAPKDGGYRLHCELAAEHDGWHKAVYHDSREITYLGSHHLIEATETVTWEPVDHVKEAVARLMTGHDASPVTTKRVGPADDNADQPSGDEKEIQR